VPIVDYQCEKCGKVFEEVFIHETPPETYVCPYCKGKSKRKWTWRKSKGKFKDGWIYEPIANYIKDFDSDKDFESNNDVKEYLREKQIGRNIFIF